MIWGIDFSWADIAIIVVFLFYAYAFNKLEQRIKALEDRVARTNS